MDEMTDHRVGSAGRVEVACAFCGGKGKDRFGKMYAGSTCEVCGGAGMRRLARPVAECVYCRGTGVYPGSWLTCTSCGGVGQVTIPKEAETCPACSGSGRAKDDYWPDSPLPCSVCGGKGVVASHRRPEVNETADEMGAEAV